MHNGEVTNIKSSPDGRYVFSAGDDGSIFVFQVSEITPDGRIISTKAHDLKKSIEEGKDINPRAMVVDEKLSEVVLFTKSKIDEFVDELKRLRQDAEDLENKLELTIQ